MLQEEKKEKLIKLINHFGDNLMNDRINCDEISLEFDKKKKKYYLGIYIYSEDFDNEIKHVIECINSKQRDLENKSVFFIRTDLEYIGVSNIYKVLSQVQFPKNKLDPKPELYSQAEVIFYRRHIGELQYSSLKGLFNESIDSCSTIPSAGCSINIKVNSHSTNPGTLGGTFYDDKNNKYVLTCAHVLTDNNGNCMNNDVFSPYLGGNPSIGKVVWCKYKKDNHDIALVKLIDNNSVSDNFKLQNEPYIRKTSSSFEHDDPVKFCGYASSDEVFSEGNIESICCTKRLLKKKDIFITDAKKIDSGDVKEGDSGSLIFDENFEYIYGILFKANVIEDKAYFKSIDIIRKIKNINIKLNN